MDTYDKIKSTMLVYADNQFPIIDGLPNPDHTTPADFMPWVMECKEHFGDLDMGINAERFEACEIAQKAYRETYPQLCNNFTLSAFDL